MARKPGGTKAGKRAGAKGATSPAPAVGRPVKKQRNATNAIETVEALQARLGLDDLDAVDKKMVAIVWANPGITDAELARLFGYERVAINKRRNRPAFQRAIDYQLLDAWGILQANQRRAAERLGELIESTNEFIAKGAAETHLRPMLAARGVGGVGGAAGGAASDAESWLGMLEESYKARQASGVIKQVGAASTAAAEKAG